MAWGPAPVPAPEEGPRPAPDPEQAWAPWNPGKGEWNQQWAGHLLRRGVDGFVALELVLTWNRERCRPPLGDDEVIAVVDSIAKRERSRLLGATL